MTEQKEKQLTFFLEFLRTTVWGGTYEKNT
jgi:hypothetical protein